MRFLAKFTALIVVIVLVVSGYLYVQHPFVFQGWAANLGLPRVFLQMSQFKVDHDMSTIEQFDAFIAAELEANSVPGAAVALVEDGNIVWQKAYGFANVEDGMLVSAETPFMLGSISKAVTGVTLMHAVEAGLLDLDADINDYLPFTVTNPHIEDGAPITLRHLATHTSGIVDSGWVYDNSYEYGDPSVSLEQFLRAYLLEGGEHYDADKNFLAKSPGEESDYSNIATGLAAFILESATRIPFSDYAQENIFRPLGMNNTGWFLADFADTSLIARPYGFMNRPIPHYGYPTWPEGQLRSSASDLSRLLAMVMNGGEFDGTRILKSETVEAMLQKQTFKGLEEVTGDGIFWSYIKGKGAGVGHNGGDHGVSTGMYFSTETNLGIVVLTNAGISRGTLPVTKAFYQIVSGDNAQAIIDSIP